MSVFKKFLFRQSLCCENNVNEHKTETEFSTYRTVKLCFLIQGNSYLPFTIEEHPKTQTQPEGSRVELKCIGKGEKVIYEWFKDEERLPEEKSSSLILDPLKVQDFGFYRCELKSCTDADQHNSSFVTSRTAELDVAPSDGRSESIHQ